MTGPRHRKSERKGSYKSSRVPRRHGAEGTFKPSRGAMTGRRQDKAVWSKMRGRRHNKEETMGHMYSQSELTGRQHTKREPRMGPHESIRGESI